MAFARFTMDEVSSMQQIYEIDTQICEQKDLLEIESLKKQRESIQKDLKDFLYTRLNDQKLEIKSLKSRINPFISEDKISSYDLNEYYKSEYNDLIICCEEIESILDEIKENNFHPKWILDPLMRNFQHKNAIITSKNIKLIDRIKILTEMSYKICHTPEANTIDKDTAIFCYLDAIFLANQQLKELSNDDNEKKEFYKQISTALSHLSTIYINDNARFKDKQFKPYLLRLYENLCEINDDENYRNNLSIFNKRYNNNFNNLNQFSGFLKNQFNKKCTLNTTTVIAGVVCASAFYSLPLASTLLFGAGTLRVAEKLNEHYEPKKYSASRKLNI